MFIIYNINMFIIYNINMFIIYNINMFIIYNINMFIICNINMFTIYNKKYIIFIPDNAQNIGKIGAPWGVYLWCSLLPYEKLYVSLSRFCAKGTCNMKQTVTFASDGHVGHVVKNGHVVTVQTVFRIVSAVTIPKNHMWYRMGYIVMFIIV